MSKEFIIVIEVDNVRAAAAYNKGLEDLDKVMSQLLVYADKHDTKEQIEYNAKLLQYEDKVKKYKEEMKIYDKAVADWHNRSVFKGPYPDQPVNCYPYHSQYPYRPTFYTEYYKSIRQELQDLADIASAATSPYRMTEYQVKEMVKWENGRRIEEIMKEVKV